MGVPAENNPLEVALEIVPPPSDLERLARALYWKMEHLDPSASADWEDLTSREKEFYCLCVQHLMQHENEIRRLLGAR
jgi:hypothetical protein